MRPIEYNYIFLFIFFKREKYLEKSFTQLHTKPAVFLLIFSFFKQEFSYSSQQLAMKSCNKAFTYHCTHYTVWKCVCLLVCVYVYMSVLMDLIVVVMKFWLVANRVLVRERVIWVHKTLWVTCLSSRSQTYLQQSQDLVMLESIILQTLGKFGTGESGSMSHHHVRVKRE